MSNTFTLDDIRAAADAKYGSTFIDLGESKVELVNPIRLPKADRDKLTSLQDELGGEGDVDQGELIEDALRTVAKTRKQGEELVEALGGDLALLAEVFESYGSEVQAGEA